MVVRLNKIKKLNSTYTMKWDYRVHTLMLKLIFVLFIPSGSYNLDRSREYLREISSIYKEMTSHRAYSIETTSIESTLCHRCVPAGLFPFSIVAVG